MEKIENAILDILLRLMGALDNNYVKVFVAGLAAAFIRDIVK